MSRARPLRPALAMPSRSREPRCQSSDANSRTLYGSSQGGARPYNQLARHTLETPLQTILASTVLPLSVFTHALLSPKAQLAPRVCLPTNAPTARTAFELAAAVAAAAAVVFNVSLPHPHSHSLRPRRIARAAQLASSKVASCSTISEVMRSPGLARASRLATSLIRRRALSAASPLPIHPCSSRIVGTILRMK